MDLFFGFYPQTYLLVLFRVLAILTPALMYGRIMVPRKVMAAMAFVIALALTPMVPDSWIVAAVGIRTIPQMLFALLGEILLGAMIGLILNLFIGVCLIGGTIAGWGSSLLMSQAIDPITGVNDVILAQVVQSVFIVIFLISNGHLYLLKMLAASFSIVPPHLGWLSAGLMDSLLTMGSDMFQWGVRFGFPVMASVLIVDAGFGLIARMAPEFDILFLSFPVRLIVALSALGLSLRYGGGFFANLVDMSLRACAQILM